MPGRECYHCKQWVEEGEAHDCWTTTESALTADLTEDLRDAWERLRESAAEFGEQRIYASHSSIMFSRRSCYFFVRPKRQFLEVCIFLGRPLKSPRVRRVLPSSKTKFANMLRIVHRDEVEPPITDWLREAYEYVDSAAAPKASPKHGASRAKAARASTKRVKPSMKRAKAAKAAPKRAKVSPKQAK
jgi:hypothetical protein